MTTWQIDNKDTFADSHGLWLITVRAGESVGQRVIVGGVTYYSKQQSNNKTTEGIRKHAMDEAKETIDLHNAMHSTYGMSNFSNI